MATTRPASGGSDGSPESDSIDRRSTDRMNKKNPQFARHRYPLLQLIADVRRLKRAPNDVRLCLIIQERLIVSIRRLERRYRSKTLVLKVSRTALNISGLSKAARQEGKLNIDQLCKLLEGLRDLMFIYRMVGDAIAYIYLDRYDIKPLSIKESPGFLTKKKGLRLELYFVRTALRRGRVAILNDLTNCLRYADITLPKKNGKADFAEVKSGKLRFPRDERQIEKLKEMADYLGIDKPISLYGYTDQKFRRVSLVRHPTEHVTEINSLLRRSRRSGVARKEVEAGLHYLVFRQGVTDPEMILGPLEGKIDRPSLLMLTTAREYWPSYYSLMLSCRNPDDLLDIVFGEAFIWVVLSFGEVERQLQARGIRVENEPEGSDFQLTLTHGPPHEGAVSKIGTHFLFRLVTEFVSLAWLIDEIATIPDRLALEEDDANSSNEEILPPPTTSE
jgi:hypothetical protein